MTLRRYAPFVAGAVLALSFATAASAADPYLSQYFGPATFTSGVRFTPYSYPQTAIGRLTFTEPSGARQYCTASVWTSDTESVIATAGHCLYDYQLGKFNSNFQFVPGFNANIANQYRYHVNQATVTGSWAAVGNNHDDFGALLVNTRSGVTIQKAKGSLGYEINSPQKDHRYTFNINGYPSNIGSGRYMRYCHGDLAEYTGYPNYPSTRSDDGAYYVIGCDMKNGASGAPFFDSNKITRSVLHGPDIGNGDNRVIGGWMNFQVKDTIRAVQGLPLGTSAGPTPARMSSSGVTPAPDYTDAELMAATPMDDWGAPAQTGSNPEAGQDAGRDQSPQLVAPTMPQS